MATDYRVMAGELLADGPIATGRALKAARIQAGKDQKQAAKVVGVSPITVSRWERGAQRVAEDHVAQLLKFYRATDSAVAPTAASSGRRVIHVREPEPAAEPRVRTTPMRAAMHGLLGDLAAIITEQDERIIRDTYARVEESLMPYGGHSTTEPTEADLAMEANALTVGLRAWALERHRRRTE